MSDWPDRLLERYAADRALVQAVYADAPGAATDPAAALVRHQRDGFAVPLERFRMPEYFRGPWTEAEAAFLGPHAEWVGEGDFPAWGDADGEAYLAYCQAVREQRNPYGHYAAIMDGRPYLALELVPWRSEKEHALAALKAPGGPALAERTLEVAWSLLRASPVRVLVLTGNDALRWVLPALGHGARPAGVTQLHGQTLGRFPLPGAPDRTLTVVASFHWSKEMPMFVRKVSSLAGLPVREAIGRARGMVAGAIAGAR